MKLVKSLLTLAVMSTSITVNAQTYEKLHQGGINDTLIKQAQDEGSVIFSVWYLQPKWREFVREFEDKYDVKVRIPEGSMDGTFNKLLAEQKREKGRMDVIALSPTQISLAVRQEAIAKVDQLDNYATSVHRVNNIDLNGYAIAFWGNKTGLAYNSLIIDDKEIPQTFEQLQYFITNNPKRFGYNDPNTGGAGAGFIERMVTINSDPFDPQEKPTEKVLTQWSKAWDWFNGNKENMVISASGADSLNRLNDGEIAIAPAWEDHLLGLQNSGAISKNVKFYVPEFGMPSGGNVVAIAANTQKPAASILFTNWLVSPETQQRMHDKFGSVIMVKDTTDTTATEVPHFNKELATELKKQFINKVVLGD
ncbi:ABC transporter substrate-binding protein [Vibrio sp. M250220]|uniref:ABC transporter substrate-binding protein n=1 Tax=Vibrio sp. M250220 TaxID=3020894 RepID=UPI002F418F7B